MSPWEYEIPYAPIDIRDSYLTSHSCPQIKSQNEYEYPRRTFLPVVVDTDFALHLALLVTGWNPPVVNALIAGKRVTMMSFITLGN